jgi:Recombinase
VTGVIATVFEWFAACGSARAVWLWLRAQGLKWPLTPTAYLHGTDIRWVEPTYHAVHNVLTHPAYAGAYVYGRTKFERRLGTDGQIRTRRRVLPREQWQVLIENHHPGYIDWDTYLANTAKIAANTRPVRHEPGTGAIREGCALLQGLAACGICSRKLAVFYQGPSKTTPGYYCTGTGALVDGRGTRHLQCGGLAIDAAVADAFLATLAPAALSACLAAVEELEHGHDTALAGHRREVERSRYDATRAERRYRAVDPDNRLVARGLEADWEKTLAALAAAEAELARRQKRRPAALSPGERATVLALGDDLNGIWAPADHHR